MIVPFRLAFPAAAPVLLDLTVFWPDYPGAVGTNYANRRQRVEIVGLLLSAKLGSQVDLIVDTADDFTDDPAIVFSTNDTIVAGGGKYITLNTPIVVPLNNYVGVDVVAFKSAGTEDEIAGFLDVNLLNYGG